MNPISTMSATAEASAIAPAVTPKENPASKEMFLQLLVAQIKNQNPLSPTDGVEFLTQLSQFSGVEQLTAIRADIAALRSHLEQPAESAPAAKAQ